MVRGNNNNITMKKEHLFLHNVRDHRQLPLAGQMQGEERAQASGMTTGSCSVDRIVSRFVLLKGTVIKRNGIPAMLMQDVEVEMMTGNHKLFFSHEEQLSENPVHAASPDTCATSNSSF